MRISVLAILVATTLLLPAAVLAAPATTTTAPAAPAAKPSAPGKPAAEAAKKPAVVYLADRDQLVINARGEPLSQLLAELSRQSGLEVRLDPKADRPVTLETKPLPLLQAVDALTAQLNTIKQFGDRPKPLTARPEPAGKAGAKTPAKAPAKTAASAAPLLIAITVLPKGQVDVSRATPVLAQGKEIELRAERNRKGHDRYTARERWQVRLDKMPPKMRANFEEKLKPRELSPQELARQEKIRAARVKKEEEDKRRWERMEKMRAERKLKDPDTGEDPRSRIHFTPPGEKK